MARAQRVSTPRYTQPPLCNLWSGAYVPLSLPLPSPSRQEDSGIVGGNVPLSFASARTRAQDNTSTRQQVCLQSICLGSDPASHIRLALVNGPCTNPNNLTSKQANMQTRGHTYFIASMQSGKAALQDDCKITWHQCIIANSNQASK